MLYPHTFLVIADFSTCDTPLESMRFADNTIMSHLANGRQPCAHEPNVILRVRFQGKNVQISY